jgi:hypothetical protein
VTEPNQNTQITPRLLVDPDAIASRLETLDQTPLCDSCRHAIIPVAADTVRLLIEAIRLWDALSTARLESANRLAAMRAALAAAAESEPDPLAYLRHEISADRMDAGWRR